MTLQSSIAFSANNRGRSYVLQLFLTGMSPRSTAALSALKAICEEFLPADTSSRSSTSTTTRKPRMKSRSWLRPRSFATGRSPERRLIGDLSDRSVVLRTLDLG